MINGILDEIRIVEKEAEEIMQKADESAKQAVLNADEESRNIRLTAIKAVKEERRKVVESAEKDGNIQYAKIIFSGKSETDKLVKDTDITEAVNFIKEKVLSSYVNS